MRNRIKLLLMAVTIGVTLVVSGCDKADPAVSQPAANPPQKTVEQVQPATATQRPEQTMQIVVYHATKDARHVVAETHNLPLNSHPARTAIELMIAGTQNSQLVSVMPPGVKLRNVTVKDHVAYVDFDDKLIKNNSGGSASETLLVGAIVNTLTEFPDVYKVQILVNGKKIETITGHVDVSEPLSRSEQLIKR